MQNAPVPANPSRPVDPPALWRVLCGLYLIFLAVYLASSNGHFLSTDHVAVYLTTKSLVEERKLSIPFVNTEVRGPDGQYYSLYGVLQSVLAIPFYAAGKWAENASSPAGRAYWGGEDLGQWGGATPIFFVSLFNQFVTPLVCLLVYLFERRMGFAHRNSLLVTFAFGLGTLAWVQARDFFQHPLETFWLAAAVYSLFAHRQQLGVRHAALSGGALALGLLTRSNMIMVIPLAALYLVYILQTRPCDAAAPVEQGSRSLPAAIRSTGARFWSDGNRRCLLAFAAPIIPSFALLLYLNQVRFGAAWIFLPGAARLGFADPWWIGLYANILSPGRSIFLYSLPLVLAAFGWSKFYRQHRAEAWLVLALSVSYLGLYSFYGVWHGGWGWGPRFLLPVVPLLILPLGYVTHSRAGRYAVIAITGLGAAVQLLPILVNWSFIHRQWMAMGYDTIKNPEYIFLPTVSPIPMHLQALLQGRYLDLRLVWIYQQYGAWALIETALPFAILLVGGIYLLTPQQSTDTA